MLFGLSEATIRLIAFLAIFFTMAGWEIWSPRRQLSQSKGLRWLTNLGMLVVSSLLVRVLFPAAAVGAAVAAEQNGWGLFHLWAVNPLVAGVIAFVLLDFAVWLEHWASHKIPLLWRFHKVHHSDRDFDVTLAVRFHPVEIVISMVWKAAVVVALGAPVLAVLLFEIVLNGTAMFNHSNARVPLGIDRWLRLLIVTPDMHRVHHSVYRSEHDTNFGFNFSFWDRLFNLYTPQPRDGHERMTIGLSAYQISATSNLLWALILPFRPNVRDGARSSRRDHALNKS